jgi:flagella basal body P-ring formation protein FlgA
LRVTRRTRVINEKELKAQLTAALQKMQGADHGDIEVQITHPTGDVVVGTGPAALQLVDFPATGLNSTMVLRFQMASEAEVFGTWQASVQVHLWRDILVASGMLARGQELAEAEVESERRDVLQMRDALSASRRSDASLELIENVNPGTVLTVRSVRRRPLVQRGKVVAAQVVDGPLNITVKVEVLEDGASGQTVRVRNLQSKREFQGKVQNDQTVLVTL